MPTWKRYTPHQQVNARSPIWDCLLSRTLLFAQLGKRSMASASPCVLLYRCVHALRFFMEGGQPVVVWKEHDDDSQPWVGRHEGTGAGFGWPVFTSLDAIPKLEHGGRGSRVREAQD